MPTSFTDFWDTFEPDLARRLASLPPRKRKKLAHEAERRARAMARFAEDANELKAIALSALSDKNV